MLPLITQGAKISPRSAASQKAKSISGLASSGLASGVRVTHDLGERRVVDTALHTIFTSVLQPSWRVAVSYAVSPSGQPNVLR